MNNPVISAENLAVGYKTPLIKDICLEVHGGEIMTLIGPNGSGKSTILKTLADELKKHGGVVFIDGKDTEKLSGKEKAQNMSLLLTESVRPSLMTCREVVETGRYPYTGYFGTLSEADIKAVNEAIELVRIQDLEDQDFAKVSDGQRQRVMLAKAICQEPRVLILDEPASYLDINYKIELAELLKRLAKEKQLAVIMSMHELEFVREISDYVVCVKEGKILKQGRTAEIFNSGTIKELFDISDEMYKRYIIKQTGGREQ